MKDIIKWIKIIFSLLLMVLVCIFLFKIKWSNAGMSGTRLLMTYWKEYIVSIVLSSIGYFIIKKECI